MSKKLKIQVLIAIASILMIILIYLQVDYSICTSELSDKFQEQNQHFFESQRLFGEISRNHVIVVEEMLSYYLPCDKDGDASQSVNHLKKQKTELWSQYIQNNDELIKRIDKAREQQSICRTKENRVFWPIIPLFFIHMTIFLYSGLKHAK